MNTDYIKGFLLTALGVLVLSFDALLIRLIEADSFSLLFWRGLLLSLGVTFWCRYSQPGCRLIQFDAVYLRSAFFYALSTVAFVVAINKTQVANVLVIISTVPLFAALIAWLFLGEKSPLITWIAIAVAMLGIARVLSDSWQSPTLGGDLLALVCSLSIAIKFVNDRGVRDRNMTPALILAGLLIAGAGLFAGHPLSLQGNDWGWMLLLGLFVIPVAFVLITLGPMRIPAADVGMLMLLETVIGPLWVWLWLDEAPGRAALQGGAIVIATLFVHGLFQWRYGRA
ncbi:MAG: DMT family transporter [Gammaproteobacteria bacterium]|nr:DMT family transporter [Gammaproteobacteria bacterium]